GVDLVDDELHLLFTRAADLAFADVVGLPPTRRRQEPRVGVVRYAVHRPRAQRCREGVAERVFGAGDVARAGREQGDQPPVALTPETFGGAMRVLHSSALLAGFRVDQRPDLDRSVTARRAALCPDDGLVQAGSLHEEVAGELLFRVGIGSVEHVGFAVVLAHG